MIFIIHVNKEWLSPFEEALTNAYCDHKTDAAQQRNSF
jgi:hypothetical protein